MEGNTINRNTILFSLIIVFAVLMIICWIINLVRASKNKKPIPVLGHIVYISGMLCIILNAFRCWELYESSRGIFITAHAIALVSILSAFIRSHS